MPDVAGEFEAADTQLREWLGDGINPEDIAVLARSQRQLQELEGALSGRELDVQVVERDKKPKPGAVQLRTMHAAKGMEFRCVLLFGVNAQHIPADWAMSALPDAEKQDALQRERSLLYVAASRARDELAITWHGKPSSLLEGTSP